MTAPIDLLVTYLISIEFDSGRVKVQDKAYCSIVSSGL